MSSYIQQYIEKKGGSPERASNVSPSKLKLDLSDMSESPAKTSNHDHYPMDFELNEHSMQSGDDYTVGKSPLNVSYNKSPTRSKIPLPQSKRNTPQSYQDLEFSKTLDKKLRIKEAEVSRLEQELKSLRESLSNKVKETATSSRNVKDSFVRTIVVRDQRIRMPGFPYGLPEAEKDLAVELEKAQLTIQKLKSSGEATQSELQKVTAAYHKIHTQIEESSTDVPKQTSTWDVAKRAFLIAENVLLLGGFCYFAYYEYKADAERRERASKSWLGF